MLWTLSFYTPQRAFCFRTQQNALGMSKSLRNRARCSKMEQDAPKRSVGSLPLLLLNGASQLRSFGEQICNLFPFISLLHRDTSPQRLLESKKDAFSYQRTPCFALYTPNYAFPFSFEHGFAFSTPFYPSCKSLVSFPSF